MANVNRPSGFTYVGNLSATGRANVKPRKFKKEASVILAPGDPVVLTGDSETTTGIALVTRAAGASGTITGVMVSRAPDPDNLSKKHFAAADTGYLYAIVDPDALFEIQEDSDTSNIAGTDVGRGVDIIVANADTTRGLSNVMLDSSTVGQAQCRIHEKVQANDNEIGSYCRWVVSIDEHTFRAASTLI